MILFRAFFFALICLNVSQSLPTTLLSFINHNLLKLKQPASPQPRKSHLIKERAFLAHIWLYLQVLLHFIYCWILFAFRELMWMFVTRKKLQKIRKVLKVLRRITKKLR